MKTTLIAAALVLTSAAHAQTPPTPTERREPARPERPAPPSHHAPPPVTVVRPGFTAPPRLAQPAPPAYHPIPDAAAGERVLEKPTGAPEPRYGVMRSAPGTATPPGIWAHHRSQWGWNGHRVYAGGYVFPRGHRYLRRRPGQRLSLVFLASSYWFADYAAAGFDDPPDGCEWIRYGPDLLLVDIDTGEIIDVEYDVFD